MQRSKIYQTIISALAIAWLLPAQSFAHVTGHDFAALVKKLTPAVVNVATTRTSDFSTTPAVNYGSPQASKGVSLGSGFLIDSAGIVVTNNHVVAQSDTIVVTLHNGDEYKAVIRGRDPETDLAVLDLVNVTSRLPSLRFGNSNETQVGNWVIAIGNPFGFGGSVSAGIISARNRVIQSGLFDDFIQTDAAINQGNSGGPLFNMDGAVIGVNTVIYSRTGGSDGVGFAVPSNLAASVVEQLITHKETRRGWLGINLAELDREKASALNLPTHKGALVATVIRDGPAMLAGLQSGDLITKYDTKRITTIQELTRAVAQTPVGTQVTIRFYRQDGYHTSLVTVDRRENVLQLSSFEPKETDGFTSQSGIMLNDSTPYLRRAFGLAAGTQGVVVTGLLADSPVNGVLQPGDIILELDNTHVLSAHSLTQRLDRLNDLPTDPVKIYIKRGDILFYEMLRP